MLFKWAGSHHFLLTEEKDVAEVRNRMQENGQVLAFSISIGHSNSNFGCGQVFVFIIIYRVKGEKMKYVMDLSQPLCYAICCCNLIESLSKLHLNVVANFVLMNRCIQFCFYY